MTTPACLKLTPGRPLRNGTYAATMQSKLSAAEVVALRERAAAGEDDRSLALAFGIARHSVVAIRTGTRWPEAGGPITRRAAPGPSKLLRERIRRALERGETQLEIATREGCSLQAVVRVAHPVVGVRRFERLEREVAALRAELAQVLAAVA